MCEETFIGKRIQNFHIRSKDNEDIWKEFETASFITIVGPTLNIQLDTKRLYLLFNGVI